MMSLQLRESLSSTLMLPLRYFPPEQFEFRAIINILKTLLFLKRKQNLKIPNSILSLASLA